MGSGRAYGDDSPAGRIVEVEIVMKTNIEKYIIGNRKLMRMLTVAAACFVSLERACVRRAGEAGNNSEATDSEESDNE